MPGHAVVLSVGEPFVDEGNLRLTFSATFYDATVLPNGEGQAVPVTFPFAATLAQIEEAIVDQTIAVAAQYYSGMTLPRANVLMLDIKRGT